MNIYRLLETLLLSLALTTSAQAQFCFADPATKGFDSRQLEQIDQAMATHIDAGELVGGLGLVARNGKIVYENAWGLRDREKQLPMAYDTVFRIYSMTKPVTSVGAMILVEEEELGLDDPVAKYLPELANIPVLSWTSREPAEVPAKREPTIRDLLRHTSGFTYGFFGNSEVDQRYTKAGVLLTDQTLADTVTKLSKIPLRDQPGTQWRYSVSTDVLARVIEVVSGQTFDRFATERIFEPLGMRDTFFLVPDEKQPRLAQLYRPNGNGKLEPARPLHSYRFVNPANQFFSGGGGLCSTARDYLIFCQTLLNEGELDGTRVLRPETVREMHTNQLDTNVRRTSGFQFGLGFAIEEDGIYRWGGAAGTRFWIDPKNCLVLIYMVQIKPTGQHNFGNEFKELVYGALIDESS
jgi:CubicO group peptidase (beta-lactamase class C family)